MIIINGYEIHNMNPEIAEENEHKIEIYLFALSLKSL